MLKRTLTVAAVAAALATPAFAQNTMKQDTAPAPTQATPVPSSNQSTTQFINQQQATDWRSSKLVGTSVYDQSNNKIGSIDDLLLDSSGKIKAAVIGVGGFLGVGSKDVAIPFEALSVQRKADSASIEKATVNFTKDQLQNAPKFAYYQPPQSRQTTGSGLTGTSRPTSPMGGGMGGTHK